MTSSFTVDGLARLVNDKVSEVCQEPDVKKSPETKYACQNGEPQVKVAVGNVPVDYDLWEGLRNPAVDGLFPAGLPEIWEFYATKANQKAKETGGQDAPQIPPSFDFPLANYRRAVIVSVMLPFSSEITGNYIGEVIAKKDEIPMSFSNMYFEVNRIIDKAIIKAAAELTAANPDAAVVAMVGDNTRIISTEIIPKTHQGLSHGPSKGGNYPQKSVAALMGLGQLGVSRLIIRDELIDGKVQRFSGPVRSIVIFDKNELVTDGSDGVINPSPAWRQFLFQLFDFTNADPKINQYRFCSHLISDGKSCSECIDICPSAAEPASAPDSSGNFSDDIVQQTKRFWQGKLQFAFEKCTEYRNEIRKSHPDWFCGRCLTVCTDRGIRRKDAVQNYASKKAELTKKTTRTAVPV